MGDTIDRQAAIDASCKYWCGCTYANCQNQFDLESERFCDGCDTVVILKKLPSAHPETHEERTETHACDCISRQTVYDALDNIKIPRNASWYPYYQQALTAVSNLPSAQPEPCEDAVSRESILSILRENYRRLGLTDKAFMELCSLMKSDPPAQPVDKDIDVPCKDTISRKTAIDALCKAGGD